VPPASVDDEGGAGRMIIAIYARVLLATLGLLACASAECA
jgi:hypothetical protein